MTEIPERVGPYRVLSKLGEGGMGAVYHAEDERLHRSVALKIIPTAPNDPARRFWQEARAAAQVSHPNACRLYDIVESTETLVLVMELLEGESLAARIARGAIPPQESVQTALSVLSALAAFHKIGIIHRDLKPANIFLSSHGTKLLDFGLAKRTILESSDQEATLTDSTNRGFFLGTPRYASPEQFRAEPVDARSDIFSVGAILYEMLTAKSPFSGDSFVDIAHSVLYKSPPPLTGSPAVAAIGRVVHRALARPPRERFPDADSMAAELRAALLLDGIESSVRTNPTRRLIVLPFRFLGPGREFEFLSFSLPETITSSLTGFDGLTVRSSIAAAQYGQEAPDLKKIAAESDVDLVLAGALLALGDQIRVTTQLVEVPAGTLVWSHTSQAGTSELLALHDDLVRRVVGSLLPSITLGECEATAQHDRPGSPAVYELYLRANEIARDWTKLPAAIELYEACVAQDPSYAPAWARLGRARWLYDKYELGNMEELQAADAAFQRAFALNPELSLAHNFYTNLQVDQGRTLDALKRLLSRAQQRNSDAELFAGLAHVCRYCGLLQSSLAAHREARRLDPKIPTSVNHTYFLLGDHQKAIEESSGDFGYARGLGLSALGLFEQAKAGLLESESLRIPRVGRIYLRSLRALLDDNHEEWREVSNLMRRARFRDPEGIYYFARQHAYVHEQEDALAALARAIQGGFFCYSAMASDPWLDSLRASKHFTDLLRIAREKRREAQEIFLANGGFSLLGVAP